MQEILYVEIPTTDATAVCTWLQQEWKPEIGQKIMTPDGIRLQGLQKTSTAQPAIPESELSIFIWTLQRTTYLKVFRWGQTLIPGENRIRQQLLSDIRKQFPP
ncbi:MAG: flavin-dependent dehydrogenase, partial [Microcystaceae cyanobacterium]